jgi:hypothetical protein
MLTAALMLEHVLVASNRLYIQICTYQKIENFVVFSTG